VVYGPGVRIASPIVTSLFLCLSWRNIAVAPASLAAFVPARRSAIVAVAIVIIAVTPHMMTVIITVAVVVTITVMVAPLLSMVTVVVFVIAAAVRKRRSGPERQAKQHY